MYNNYLSEREQDLLERGGNQMVHDYDGTIKPLKSTKIWFNQDGYYIPPRNVELIFVKSALLKFICSYSL